MSKAVQTAEASPLYLTGPSQRFCSFCRITRSRASPNIYDSRAPLAFSQGVWFELGLDNVAAIHMCRSGVFHLLLSDVRSGEYQWHTMVPLFPLTAWFPRGILVKLCTPPSLASSGSLAGLSLRTRFSALPSIWTLPGCCALDTVDFALLPDWWIWFLFVANDRNPVEVNLTTM